MWRGSILRWTLARGRWRRRLLDFHEGLGFRQEAAELGFRLDYTSFRRRICSRPRRASSILPSRYLAMARKRRRSSAIPCFEGRRQGQHFVERLSEGVNVGPGLSLAAEPLRGHVTER